MPKRSERKGIAADDALRSQPKAQEKLDAELEALLREAREALQEGEVPSGGWGVDVELPQTACADSWPGGCPQMGSGISLDGIDPETAFWLLFPPRGTA